MSMADRDGFIWYDGKLVPWRDATTHVLTHSLHYGLSVFEGVRAYRSTLGTAIFRLEDHTRRLFNSAHIYQIPMPFDRHGRPPFVKRLGCSRVAQRSPLFLMPGAWLWIIVMALDQNSTLLPTAMTQRNWGW